MPIILQPRRTVQIKLDRAYSGLLHQTGVGQPVMVTSQLSQLTEGALHVGDLLDVEIVDLVEGAMLIYNPGTDKYEVKTLPFIECGQF